MGRRRCRSMRFSKSGGLPFRLLCLILHCLHRLDRRLLLRRRNRPWMGGWVWVGGWPGWLGGWPKARQAERAIGRAPERTRTRESVQCGNYGNDSTGTLNDGGHGGGEYQKGPGAMMRACVSGFCRRHRSRSAICSRRARHWLASSSRRRAASSSLTLRSPGTAGTIVFALPGV